MQTTSKKLINSSQSKFLKHLASNPSQSILLLSSDSYDLETASGFLIDQILQQNNLGQTSLQTFFASDLGIAEVRNLQTLTARRVSRSESVHQIISLTNVEKLSLEAHNALLKILEEPSAGTIFVLTTLNVSLLPTTLRSRMHEIVVTPPTAVDYATFFSDKTSTEISQAQHLARGQTAEVFGYLTGNNQNLALAKQILNADTYERLILLQDLSSQRERALEVINLLKQLLMYILENNALKGNINDVPRLTKCLNNLQQAQAALQANGNLKLWLDWTAVNI